MKRGQWRSAQAVGSLREDSSGRGGGIQERIRAAGPKARRCFTRSDAIEVEMDVNFLLDGDQHGGVLLGLEVTVLTYNGREWAVKPEGRNSDGVGTEL
jgi:hypothetical protein